jgi:hypothetical protein
MPSDIKDLQRSLNRFTAKYLKGVAPLIVDGKQGKATNSRVMAVKYYLGYGKHRDAKAPSQFVRRMRHPHSRKYSPVSLLRTGAVRRTKQRARWVQQQAVSIFAKGVTRYDGVPVAKWMVPYLTYARNHGWKGRLVSGYRTPEYSDSLCRRMCGAPRCPGLCAGRSSNHSGSERPRGAVDVSDYDNFGRIVAHAPYSPTLINRLPRDHVHYSASGN